MSKTVILEPGETITFGHRSEIKFTGLDDGDSYTKRHCGNVVLTVNGSTPDGVTTWTCPTCEATGECTVGPMSA